MAFLKSFINELTFVLTDMGISLDVKNSNNLTASGEEAYKSKGLVSTKFKIRAT
jgi:hypothetical protein